MSKTEEVRHCPFCHQDVTPRRWACGCLRCPNCCYAFEPCIPPIKLVAVNKGICPKCGKPIIKYEAALDEQH